MINVKTANEQQVRAAVKKALQEFTDTGFVTVGFHEDAGMHESGEMTNAYLGAILHFGTRNGRIPARPFLDVGVASRDRDYAREVIKGAENNKSLEDILDRIGQTAMSAVQDYMDELASPPNAPSTIAQKKGQDNPLVDTGALKQAVNYKVQVKKPKEGLS